MPEHDPTLYEAWWRALPDARVTSSRRRLVMGPLGPMTDAYCVNCGRPYGLVTLDYVDHIFCLCQACDRRLGRLPLTPVPDDVERAISTKEA